jgi:hypothetical protein
MSAQESTVLIHGDAWSIEHIRDDVLWCRTKAGWELRPWRKRAALVDKNHSSPFVGQQLRVASQRVDPAGWDHDHCSICAWTLHECDDSASNQGYTYDGRTWMCVECFNKFVGCEGSSV